MKLHVVRKPMKILDFDTECRPMHYSEWRPESQITAYAFGWFHQQQADGSGLIQYDVLEQNLANEAWMLERFLKYYDEADMIVGHYIRKHDLPLINDHCVRLGFKPISERPSKLIQDTKVDFVSVKAMGLSQDNLATMLHLDDKKHHMTGAQWREANSLQGHRSTELTVDRVVGDVRQNMALYKALRERGALRPPSGWPTR